MRHVLMFIVLLGIFSVLLEFSGCGLVCYEVHGRIADKLTCSLTWGE